MGIDNGEGFIFNMSVGYDLAGIMTGKIDSFIEGLKNAENTDPWNTCKRWALENLPRFKRVDKAYIEGISPQVCRSITLSTLHGCPPDEIERIARYLLTEKKLHTFIKCNPTLLGYEFARGTLDGLGFDYLAFDDHHFKADLQFCDAVPMLGRLMALADSLSLQFGVKLTNTFPVQITAGELPGGEMYMSGRPLFPLSIEVANRLSKAFDGRLRISFSGGADIHNIGEICGAGIWPVTLATTLLKPGGYERLCQLAGELSGRCAAPPKRVDLEKLQALSERSGSDPLYRKPEGRPPQRKMKEQVPLLNCFQAPCRDGCPFGQDIPVYLRLAGAGNHFEALKAITRRNPLPFITGTICSHRCMDKCTRSFYEGSVDIRAVKLEAAEKAYDELMGVITCPPKQGEKIAVIGGGPAGLSAAFFLARGGFPVTIFEKRSALGGIVRHVIPEFRISGVAIDKDIGMAMAMGAEVRLNCEVVGSNARCAAQSAEPGGGGNEGPVTKIGLEDLRREGFSKIIIAVGAWKPGRLDLAQGRACDALEFLEQMKYAPETVSPGENVVVVGGGNTAMDAARAAKRAKGVKRVSLVYRRTKRYMPADAGELALATEEGIEFCELLSPIGLKDGMLTCAVMELGAPDESGRRIPERTEKTVVIPADTVISAVGNQIDADLFKQFGIPTDSRGNALFNNDTHETPLPGVYIAGDAGSGPATVAQAIADAAKSVEAITHGEVRPPDSIGLWVGNPPLPWQPEGESCTLRQLGGEPYTLNKNPDPGVAGKKKGVLYKDKTAVHESGRCLECATICESCVEVCPNRANIAITADGCTQIVHIDSLCNECGNCEVFCPYSSAPYLDKFTLFASADDFDNSKNAGFLPQYDTSVRVRLSGETSVHSDGADLPNGIWSLIEAVIGESWLR